MKHRIIILLKGICMGVADIVPGVSGGTIALITGIYEELIMTIKSVNINTIKLLVTGQWKVVIKSLNINFLLPLLLGICIAIITFIPVMHFLLENYKTYVWSFFFGLIIASAITVLKKVDSWTIMAAVIIIIGIMAGYFVTLLPLMQSGGSYISFFIAGAIAISAMILPGISGSFILLAIGKYSQVINAVKSYDFPIIIVFGLGCLFGILSFSRVIAYFFSNYKNQTLLFMSGIMIGSLNKVWPFKETITTYTNRQGEVKSLIEENIWISDVSDMRLLYGALGLCLISFLFVFIVEKVAERV